MPKSVDERDLRVAVWYLNFIMDNHYSPSLRETMEIAGVSSTSTGSMMMRRMEKKGYIKGFKRDGTN